jgi:hypothetical protein
LLATGTYLSFYTLIPSHFHQLCYYWCTMRCPNVLKSHFWLRKAIVLSYTSKLNEVK